MLRSSTLNTTLADILGDIREIEEGLRGIKTFAETKEDVDDILTLLKWAVEKVSQAGARLDQVMMDEANATPD